MLERDYNQKQPGTHAVENLWLDLTISFEDQRLDEVDELLAAMRNVFANGDAQFASFLIGPSRVLDYFAARDMLDEIQFWTRVLQTSSVTDALPWLGETYFQTKDFVFQRLNPFYLDGDIAACLVNGGAYRRYSGKANEAKALSLNFCATVFDNRYDELMVRKSEDAWASWFMIAPWDYTWLGLDRRDRRFFILCATDTD